MNLDNKIAQLKALIDQRDEIDRKLKLLLGEGPRRGRPPKQPADGQTPSSPNDEFAQ